SYAGCCASAWRRASCARCSRASSPAPSRATRGSGPPVDPRRGGLILRGMPRRLSHVDARGRVRMVDVSAKKVTARVAVARGQVFMARATLDRVARDRAPKGNVLASAHLAGVLAAKRTSEIVPLAHPVPVDAVDMAFELDRDGPSVGIEARVRTRARTGVEME